ncbi:hypothetical protein SNEBB_005679 [Seison nebaliae]|nr:hypothetical protein SNEBB_005679 [Seison nebaliae]
MYQSGKRLKTLKQSNRKLDYRRRMFQRMFQAESQKFNYADWMNNFQNQKIPLKNSQDQKFENFPHHQKIPLENIQHRKNLLENFPHQKSQMKPIPLNHFQNRKNDMEKVQLNHFQHQVNHLEEVPLKNFRRLKKFHRSDNEPSNLQRHLPISTSTDTFTELTKRVREKLQTIKRFYWFSTTTITTGAISPFSSYPSTSTTSLLTRSIETTSVVSPSGILVDESKIIKFNETNNFSYNQSATTNETIGDLRILTEKDDNKSLYSEINSMSMSQYYTFITWFIIACLLAMVNIVLFILLLLRHSKNGRFVNETIKLRCRHLTSKQSLLCKTCKNNRSSIDEISVKNLTENKRNYYGYESNSSMFESDFNERTPKKLKAKYEIDKSFEPIINSKRLTKDKECSTRTFKMKTDQLSIKKNYSIDNRLTTKLCNPVNMLKGTQSNKSVLNCTTRINLTNDGRRQPFDNEPNYVNRQNTQLTYLNDDKQEDDKKNSTTEISKEENVIGDDDKLPSNPSNYPRTCRVLERNSFIENLEIVLKENQMRNEKKKEWNNKAEISNENEDDMEIYTFNHRKKPADENNNDDDADGNNDDDAFDGEDDGMAKEKRKRDVTTCHPFVESTTTTSKMLPLRTMHWADDILSTSARTSFISDDGDENQNGINSHNTLNRHSYEKYRANHPKSFIFDVTQDGRSESFNIDQTTNNNNHRANDQLFTYRRYK